MTVSAKFFLALLFIPTICFADDYDLRCENPGREYQVIYSEGDRYVVINPDTQSARYLVLAVESGENKLVVAAQLVGTAEAPVLRAHFKPYRKMEYFVGGQVFQTDGCY
ncbi:hypothetical protein ABVF61_00345 [Roseibium sp. HPY-6]|uniref:hypothetical protein n=1 Tax=Roseibium sp. HPY-6 TaxID=3229852 RepID=UPI00339010CE